MSKASSDVSGMGFPAVSGKLLARAPATTVASPSVTIGRGPHIEPRSSTSMLSVQPTLAIMLPKPITELREFVGKSSAVYT